MRKFTLGLTIGLLVWAASVVGTQQVAAPVDLDQTMKRVGAAARAASDAISSAAYTRARMQTPVMRTGLLEAVAYFAGKKNADGLTFARNALGRLDAVESALASAASRAARPLYQGEIDLDAAMKRASAAMEATVNAIESTAYVDARRHISVMRTSLEDADSFFANRNSSGVKYAREALANLDALDARLAVPDAGAVEEAMDELQSSCGACHLAFRTRDQAMNFVLKPGAAPNADDIATRTAIAALQGACNTCHTSLWREYIAHPDR
jgi:cytochrome c556